MRQESHPHQQASTPILEKYIFEQFNIRSDCQHVQFGFFFVLFWGKSRAEMCRRLTKKQQLGKAARHQDQHKCTRGSDSRQHSFGGRSLDSSRTQRLNVTLGESKLLVTPAPYWHDGRPEF